MVLNDRQWRSASPLFWSLEVYAQSHPVMWHPGGMLPLTYRPPGATAQTGRARHLRSPHPRAGTRLAGD
jgi:hypothetical protein